MNIEDLPLFFSVKKEDGHYVAYDDCKYPLETKFDYPKVLKTSKCIPYRSYPKRNNTIQDAEFIDQINGFDIGELSIFYNLTMSISDSSVYYELKKFAAYREKRQAHTSKVRERLKNLQRISLERKLQEAYNNTAGMLHEPIHSSRYSLSKRTSNKINKLLDNCWKMHIAGTSATEIRQFCLGTYYSIRFNSPVSATWDNCECNDELQGFWDHFPESWKYIYWRSDEYPGDHYSK